MVWDVGDCGQGYEGAGEEEDGAGWAAEMFLQTPAEGGGLGLFAADDAEEDVVDEVREDQRSAEEEDGEEPAVAEVEVWGHGLCGWMRLLGGRWSWKVGEEVEDGLLESDAVVGVGVVGGEMLFDDVVVASGFEVSGQGIGGGSVAVVGGDDEDGAAGEFGCEGRDVPGGGVGHKVFGEGLGGAAGEGRHALCGECLGNALNDGGPGLRR